MNNSQEFRGDNAISKTAHAIPFAPHWKKLATGKGPARHEKQNNIGQKANYSLFSVLNNWQTMIQQVSNNR